MCPLLEPGGRGGKKGGSKLRTHLRVPWTPGWNLLVENLYISTGSFHQHPSEACLPALSARIRTCPVGGVQLSGRPIRHAPKGRVQVQSCAPWGQPARCPDPPSDSPLSSSLACALLTMAGSPHTGKTLEKAPLDYPSIGLDFISRKMLSYVYPPNPYTLYIFQETLVLTLDN